MELHFVATANVFVYYPYWKVGRTLPARGHVVAGAISVPARPRCRTPQVELAGQRRCTAHASLSERSQQPCHRSCRTGVLLNTTAYLAPPTASAPSRAWR